MKWIITLLSLCALLSARDLKIGSKKFTESVILGEIVNQLALSQGIKTEYRAELGGTRILWNALLSGEIDIYPEYSGTIINEILADQGYQNFEQITSYLEDKDLALVGPLGFNNTYAVGVLREKAKKYQLHSISDLVLIPNLKFGFTNEFMDRKDGWPALREKYNLPQKNVSGIDHDLAYKALESGSIDVTDLYSTDAEIKYYDLFVLKDDKQYFPEYHACFLLRKEIINTFADFVKSLKLLENSIDENKMIRMNADVKIEKIPVKKVAIQFLNNRYNLSLQSQSECWSDRLLKNSTDHLLLVLISLSFAILVSIPLGILSIKKKKTGQFILAVAGILQTIPSLAILVFMIPFLGIGAYPAMAALFLYSLLPIIRNTYSGINDIPNHIIESAIALGLTPWERLRFVELPLATRSILAGIKTAAVINIGTATLGALIGAGGYGQPILTGIRLDDISLILEGAVPAALLALIVQAFFDLIEKLIVKH
jgi:osmoprotectant transport system substrate-binding protein/osmoprotectant transport system permease protein